MTSVDCLFQRVSRFGAGMALLFIAMGLSLIAMLSAPAAAFVPFIAAFIFLFSPLSRKCRIS